MKKHNPRLPVKVSANGRYIVDQDDTPVFWLGTTQWELFCGYSLRDARSIISGSREAGFTFIQTKLLGGGDGTRANTSGDKPMVDDDPRKPNEAYFRNVDAVVAAAAEQNMIVSLSIFHKSYRDHFPLESMAGWASWLAARYANAPNIFWNMTPEGTESYIPIIRELARGLVETDNGRHLITFKPDPSPFSSSFMHDEAWLDFHSSQVWKDIQLIYPFVATEYTMTPPKPIVMAEGAYEQGSEYGFEVTPLWVRRQAYYSYLAGGHHAYGHNDSWRILPTWKTALSAPGALQMGILRDIFEARKEWWLLVPDQSLLAGGGVIGGRVLTLAARHARGAWIMAYLGERKEIAVTLGRQDRSDKRASWIDPRTGKGTDAGRCRNEGTATFTPPSGWEDALLVIE